VTKRAQIIANVDLRDHPSPERAYMAGLERIESALSRLRSPLPDSQAPSASGASFDFHSNLSQEEYEKMDEVFASIDQRLRKSGRRPYLIPEGGSNALGAFGYVAATEELYHQVKAQGLNIDSIVCAVGSGGTYAGLLLGKKLLKLPFEIYGINVGNTAEYFQNRIFGIVQEAIKHYQLPVEVKKEEIRIIDGYVGLGYGQSRTQELELIRDVARKEGVALDPVYTGKAMYGLLDQISQNPMRFGKNVLFLHTGGIFSLFGISKELSRLL